MPFVVEEPYEPPVRGAGRSGYFEYNYRLGGISCMASDVVGDYSFPEKLKIGDKVIIEDSMPYTMVRTSRFNGIDLPSLAIWSKADGFRIVREFEYAGYRDQLS